MTENTSNNDLDMCGELALLPGSLFEFTYRFLSPTQRIPLLAVYALKQSICSISRIPAEDSVKWAKLKWWSEELAADARSSSRHPVLRVLWSSGARDHLDDALLQRLIRDAVLQIDAAPVSDSHAMLERLAVSGSTDIQLELALDKVELDARALNFLGAATSLYRVISSYGVNQRPETEQLPMNLLAKYNISQVEPGQEQTTEGFTQLLEELAEKGLEWFSQGKAGLEASSAKRVCKHLQLRLAMEERQMRSISRNAKTIFESNQGFGPADAWFAWRFLRRLN